MVLIELFDKSAKIKYCVIEIINYLYFVSIYNIIVEFLLDDNFEID